MRSCARARSRPRLSGVTLLGTISLFLATGPRWSDSQLIIDCEDGEAFGQLTLEFDTAFATYGQRRDPWMQVEGADFGLGSLVLDGASLHKGKTHLVTFRGEGVVVRELNLVHVVNYVQQVIMANPAAAVFHASRVPGFSLAKWLAWSSSSSRVQDDDRVLIVPIPTLVAVTPWSYDETTWHDFATDTSNWLVYAGNNWAYRSMSFSIGRKPIEHMLKHTPRLLQFAPILNQVMPLSQPYFLSKHVLKQLPHQRVQRIKDLPAY